MMKIIAEIEYETLRGPFGRTECKAHVSSYEEEDGTINGDNIVTAVKKLFSNPNYFSPCVTFGYRNTTYDPCGKRHYTGRIFSLVHGNGASVVVWDENGDAFETKTVEKVTKSVIMELFNNCVENARARAF